LSYRYSAGVWIAVGIFWLAAALKSKPVTRRQTVWARVSHISIMCVGFALVFGGPLLVGPLSWRALPDWPALGWAGFALTITGLAFTVWARFVLGGNWSGTVTIKQDHELVRRGPYAVVRHPIYTGALLALLGTAMALGEVRGFVGLVVVFIGWRGKSWKEEAFMRDQFGEQYTQYEREVKGLIPFIY